MIEVDVQLRRGAFSLAVSLRTGTRVLGVFGPSGAGKSTLINLIAGLERPDAGSIVLRGRTLFDGARGIDVPVHRRSLGIVFQEHRLFPHYSVKGNLLYGARGPGAMEPVVELLELAPLMERRVGQLSGGERQRVALGRALLSGPSALLLDEPLASLDTRLRRQILPYLRRVRDALSIPIVYVSHDLAEILELTDELAVIDRGRLAGHGPYADLVHEGPVLSVVHDRGMTNLLRARIAEHHAGDGVTVLSIDRRESSGAGTAARLIAPIAREAAGREVTVSVRPWDVALATQPVDGVSIQNQVRGVVTRWSTHERRAIVEVDIGCPLIVEISRRSAAAMQVEAGRPVVCLIKSHAIRYVGGTGSERSDSSAPTCAASTAGAARQS